MAEWFKQRRVRMRLESLDRMKAFLHIHGPEDTSETTLANMGIYGLGKRRTVNQLYDFVGIDMNTMKVDKKVREFECNLTFRRCLWFNLCEHDTYLSSVLFTECQMR